MGHPAALTEGLAVIGRHEDDRARWYPGSVSAPLDAGTPFATRRIWRTLLVVAVALATYANTARNGFVWDDIEIIVRNPANAQLGSIPSLFAGVDATPTGQHARYYRPLTRSTYVVDRQLFGLEPAGYHVESAVLHALTAAGVHCMVISLFGNPLVALAAGLLTAVHPVHAEAVNFLSTRNTLLATLLFVVALVAYDRARKRGSRLPFAAVLAFLAGLLSKETAAMLVVLLPVYDLPSQAELRQTWRARARRTLPFLAALAVYIALRANALSGPLGAFASETPLATRLWNNVYILPEYARLLVFPRSLNAYYLVPAEWSAGWPGLLAAWIGLVGASILLLRVKNRAVTFGLLWMAINLIPSAGLVPLPSAPLAERYLHLPAIGAWIAAGGIFAELWQRLAPRARGALAAGGVALIALLAVRTVQRNEVWREPLVFFEAMAEASPDATLAHHSLGLARLKAGDVAGARAAWSRAAELDASYFDVAARLGGAALLQQDYVDAERWFGLALRLHPGDAGTLYNLGLLRERQGRLEEALELYRACVEKRSGRTGGPAEGALQRIEALEREPHARPGTLEPTP